ncbi:isoprenoid synthase domain-containing protein [Rhodocollybia butyracea]|uniref:Isoprenoid synthase domain-containing protein n=1 Tax=Rhodocollybia butyracea TaxID=206335 RepID=A0A9P5Q362_9AGAR|nr:isoprenoid synthase domain-containing protein [Rhodocollybia butyracea]
MKLGLLGACCFPNCDLTQLILVQDFWTLIVLDTQTVLKSEPPTKMDWLLAEDSDLGFVELLQHPLYKGLLPRLLRLQKSTSESWQNYFVSSISTYRSSQQKAFEYRCQGNILSLEIDDYIDFRRDFSGIRVVLDLIEAVGGLELDISPYNDDLRVLQRLVGDIITLAWDIFAYNIDQSIDNKINIVSLLQSKRGIGLARAISEAGALIRERLEQFKALEENLLRVEPAPTSSNTWGQSWLWWFWSLLSSNAEDPETLPASVAHDVELYINGLKNCLVGFFNWAYETEMFFGTKGESVKGFGWVFLLPPSSNTIV